MENERFFRDEMMKRWKKNTVPIYKFSDPSSPYYAGVKVADATELIHGGTKEEHAVWQSLLPQNLPRLVDEVLIENNSAENIFFGYWQRRFIRFFSSHTDKDAEDLAQAAVAEVSGAIPRFENSGPRTFTQNLHSYCYAVARYTLYDYLNEEYKRPRTYELTGKEKEQSKVEEKEPEQTGNAITWEMFWEKVKEVLPPRQWQIVDQIRTGSRNETVIRNLGLSRTSYRREIRTAKQTISDTLLVPAGLKAITDPEFRALSTDILKGACARGFMDAIKILGRWYTTEDAFNRYICRRNEQYNRLGQHIGSETPLVQTRKILIKTLVAKGLTIDEMAAEIGRHRSVVQQTLAFIRKQEELKIARPQKSSISRRVDYSEFDEMVRMRRQLGMKNEDIAVDLDCSLAHVTRAIARLVNNGLITPRPHGGIRVSLAKPSIA